MDVMNSPASLIKHIASDFPAIKFEPADAFFWSAEDNTIYYDVKADHAAWSLLHELGHMEHAHNTYSTDARLVRMEVEAWETAKQLAPRYKMSISEEHIESCMDSYRNWQYLRSKCPVCAQSGTEKKGGNYHCINCQHDWKVTANRFCRVYRLNGPLK